MGCAPSKTILNQMPNGAPTKSSSSSHVPTTEHSEKTSSSQSDSLLPSSALGSSTFIEGVWPGSPAVEGADIHTTNRTTHNLAFTEFLSQFGFFGSPAASAQETATQLSRAQQDFSKYSSTPLTRADKVMVMQGWNKVLPFRTAFSEALLSNWRLRVAFLNTTNDVSKQGQGAPTGKTMRRASASTVFSQLERNQDPLAKALQYRLGDAEDMIVGVLDGAIRQLCPHMQMVAREAYRPIAESVHLERSRTTDTMLRLDCETVQDYFLFFARCGVVPEYWVQFVDAVEWAWRTHAPYTKEDDKEDLDRGAESAVLRTVVQYVCLPAIEEWKKLRTLGEQELYKTHIPQFWEELPKADLGERFYRRLLTEYPDLLDYFSCTDMDSMAGHLIMSLEVIVKSASQLGCAKCAFRSLLDHLGEIHLRMGVPTYAYPLLGQNLVECLEPHFAEAVQRAAGGGQVTKSATAEELQTGILTLYSHVMGLVYYPMLRREKLLTQAREFLEAAGTELSWSDAALKKRIAQVEHEIATTGTYIHTSQELELGARLAWRNSAKCVGRISWNTLKVRDCRHVVEPSQIFAEVEEHLRLATAGTNIQSVMTVFRPTDQLRETFGTRFWSQQCIRYAGYRDRMTGKVLGDPANVELTEYLIGKGLWTPPEQGRTAFDVLPLVLKVPGRELPFVHSLPPERVFEVPIEHPTCEGFASLGMRWTTVPAITNFKLNIGGVQYDNIPFNGWFVSVEIVRNLMERYDVGPEVAALFGMDVSSDPMWRQHVSCEVERAVLHSFKKHGYTIVDPNAVGESFCSHVRRERDVHGRECPAQWSWIGGLLGPTNPTWHLEMRDFVVRPQYDYTVDGLLLYTCWKADPSLECSIAEPSWDPSSSVMSVSVSSLSVSSVISRPRVLILYGSETGKAEAAARKLKRLLRELKPQLMTLNAAAGLSIVRRRGITHLLCVTSTFGAGQAPSNAAHFFETAIDKQVGSAKFSVLALGSSLYPDFCSAGTKLDMLLSRTGMERMTESLTRADDAVDGDATIAEWLDAVKKLILPSYLERSLSMLVGSTRGSIALCQRSQTQFRWLPRPTGSRGNMVASGREAVKSSGVGSRCLSNVELLPSKSTRSVRKLTFAVPRGATYHSGDHLAVKPRNLPGMVKRFRSCFVGELGGQDRFTQPFELDSIDGDDCLPADVCFATPATLNGLLESELDFALTRSYAMDLLDLCAEQIVQTQRVVREEEDVESLKFQHVLDLKRSVAGVSAEMDRFLARYPTIVHFFEEFDFLVGKSKFREGQPPPVISLADVLTIMPRLQQRYYSISSSGAVTPHEVSITVGVLKTKTSEGVELDGICSHYLARLHGPSRTLVDIKILESSLRLPEKLDGQPIVLVCAGTGVSPMMGFLEDLALEKRNTAERGRGGRLGPVYLFFGCRTERDVLYRDQLEEYRASGLLQLYLALSRPKSGGPGKYVQDEMQQMGKEVTDLLLNEKTHYYVCGDARMANACQETCVNLLRQNNAMTRVAAVQHIQQMRIECRWQSDVWGVVSNFEEAKQSIEASKRRSAEIWLSKFQKSFSQSSVAVVAGSI